MADLNTVAKEVFQNLQSYNYTMRLYDDTGKLVSEPAEARRFMCMPKNLMVAIVDDNDNSRIALTLGKSVHINDVMGLDQMLKTTATKYNMIYKAQQSGERITPRNFVALASIREDFAMQVCEGMYGTSRSSYLRLENARMIVRHKSRIDDSKIGARGRCVESVLIENDAGERNRMPTNSLMAGRAMTQHVNQGGDFHDTVGQQIVEMATQYGNLATGVGAALGEAAGMVREACRAKMGKLRKTFEQMYRESSYAAEAEAIAAQANMLTETKVDATRIDELRQLLNGDVSDEVVECCCKAMDEMKPVNEGRMKAVPTKTILGKPVAIAAWEAFLGGHLNMMHAPDLADADLPAAGGMKRAWSKVVAMANKLSRIADVVEDDGLSNLFRQVADDMPDESNPERQRIYRAIAFQALKAAAKGDALADKNEIVAEHLKWLESFDPDRRLMEAWSPMDPSFDTQLSDDAADWVIAEFSADEFIHSEQMQDILDGREPHSEENHLGHDEVMQALASYLRHCLDMNSPEQIGGFDDVSDLAKLVYDDAVTALHDLGFVVDEGDGLTEEEELTSEDVLLPKRNQGDDLASEVTKADITDPDDPDQHGPVNSRYTARLMTLAGMNNSGQSGPGY